MKRSNGNAASQAKKIQKTLFGGLTLFLITFAAYCAGPETDSIDQLVDELSKTNGLWTNGVFQPIELPDAANVETIIEQVFQVTGFDQGRISNYQISKIKKVQIPGFPSEPYTAVLVETNFGKKIVLLQYQKAGWWSRVYDDRFERKIAAEGQPCVSKEDCKAVDCSKYDGPVKEGYKASCESNRCECMCYGCE